MILSGSVRIVDTNYYFNRIEKDNSVSWFVYSATATIDGQQYILSQDRLFKFDTKSLKPFLVSATEITVDSHKSYGNFYIINQITRAMSMALNTHYDNAIEEITDEFSQPVADTLESIGDDTKGELVGKEANTSKVVDKSVKFSGSNNRCRIEYVRRAKASKFMSKETIKGEYLSINFTANDVTLKTLNYKASSFLRRKFDIEWQDVNDFKNANKFRELNLSMKAKTLSQLRAIRDLSWYFDNNGKSKKDYKVVDTLDKLQYYCDNVFPNIKYWAYDIESTGLDFYIHKDMSLMDHIVSIMFSWKKDQAIFIPIDMEYMPNIDGKKAMEMLRPFLENIPCGGHNIGFDARATYVEYGIKINIHDDTQILNFNRNTHSAKFNNSLKYLEHKFLGVDTLELKDIFGTSKLAGLFRYLPRELALIYACPDVDYWLQVFEILMEKLDTSCIQCYRLDMSTLKHIYLADCNGNRVAMNMALQLRDCNNRDKDVLEQLIYKFVGQEVKLRNYVKELEVEAIRNDYSAEQCENLLQDFIRSDDYKLAKYEFKIGSGDALGHVMYEMLEYPVLATSAKTKKPAVNSKALKGLLRENAKIPGTWLRDDIPSAMLDVDPKADPLIKAKDFNSKMYPLPLLIAEYRLRDKRDSTFFKALIDRSIGGMYYTQSKMASAETFRIINTVQVLQGVMKKLIIPISDDHYMLVFDFSQIEYRYMGGMAHVQTLIEKLNHLRADFHTECCSLLNDIEPWLVTKSMRSDGKSLNFAIPYGMELHSICESLYKVVNDKNLVKAQRQLNKWYKIFYQIKDYLDRMRKFALDNGYVSNENGRRRYFYNDDDMTLDEWKDDLNKSRMGAIKRASGNYPIQSGAADLFKVAFIRFRNRLEKEGLGDLVKTSALVHDEIVSSVHKSVNPFFLYRIIYEECMLTLKGHPRYFAGVSIVDNWYEGKADLYEAPMEFVEYALNNGMGDEKFVWQDDAKTNVLNSIRAYMKDTYIREFKELGIDLNNEVLDLKSLLTNLTDYFLRGKMSLYYEPVKSKDDPVLKADVYENDVFIRGFEKFVMTEGILDSYTIIYPDDYPLGKYGRLTKDGREFIDETGTTTFFVNYTKPNEPVAEDFEDDLTFDFFGDSVGDLDTFDALDILEEDDEELSAPVFFYMPNGISQEKDEFELMEENPEQYVKLYDTELTKVRVERHRIVIDLTDIPYEDRSKVADYCNKFAVSKDELGAIEVVFKIGINYRNTNVFIRNYSLKELKELVEKKEVMA